MKLGSSTTGITGKKKSIIHVAIFTIQKNPTSSVITMTLIYFKFAFISLI